MNNNLISEKIKRGSKLTMQENLLNYLIKHKEMRYVKDFKRDAGK